MSKYTIPELEDLVKQGKVKSSDARNDIFFFESKDLDIHEYRNIKTGATVPGTTSSIGGITKVLGIGEKDNRYSGLVIDAETDSIIDRATMSRSSERGTRLHEALEHWVGQHSGTSTKEQLEAAIKGLKNEEELAAYESTVKFFETNEVLKTFDLSQAKTEISVSSSKHGFAGTIDLWTKTHSGQDVILDYKFGKEVKRKAGFQTAANAITLKENYGVEDVQRYILHNAEPGKGEVHTPKLYSEAKSPKIFGKLAEDQDKFLEYLSESIKSGGKNEATLEEAANIAKLNIINAFKATEEGKKFGKVHIGFGENGEVQQEIVDFFGSVAKDMGLKMQDGVETSKKKGLLYGFEKEAEATKEQQAAFKLAKDNFEYYAKKESVPLLDALNHEWNEIKSIEVGDTLRGLKTLGDKASGDLLSALSKSSSLKAAAVGGAIGAVAGGAYAALHDNQDPTSPYEEPRNYLTDALKGAALAGGVAYGVTAGMNMRNVSSAGEMVAHVGNSARGLGGKISDLMLNAWRATGRMR